MAHLSNYLEEKLLDHTFNGVAYTPPATVYVALFDDNATSSELEAGDLSNEITGYDGNRPSVTFNAATQSDGKGMIDSDVAVEFEDMPATVVKYVALMDASTAGNLLAWSPLLDKNGDPTTKIVNEGDTFRIPLGQIRIFLD